MDPVIGLDVAKGESQVQAFLARKQSFGKTFKFKHDINGLREAATSFIYSCSMWVNE